MNVHTLQVTNIYLVSIQPRTTIFIVHIARTNFGTESEDEIQASTSDAIYSSDTPSLCENSSQCRREGDDAKVFQCLDTTATPSCERDDELHDVGTILFSIMLCKKLPLSSYCSRFLAADYHYIQKLLNYDLETSILCKNYTAHLCSTSVVRLQTMLKVGLQAHLGQSQARWTNTFLKHFIFTVNESKDW